MKISKLGLNLVRHFEGMYLRGYKCPANVWTIGYGHTGLVDGKPIHGNMIITEEKAIELLQQDMAVFENAVKDSVKVPLTQNQFDALVSFAFNVGAGALRNSTLLKLLNQGKYEEVPAQFLRWNKGGGKVLAGLTRRRKAEGHLFVTGELKTQF
jgi:lysozyme